MECMKGALKRSSLTPHQDDSVDDEFCSTSLLHAEISVVEDFFVDDFLDFSNVDDERREDEPLEGHRNNKNNNNGVCVSVADVSVSCQIEPSETGDGDFMSVDQLPVLADDDLKNLEWLSQFMEESYTAVDDFNSIHDSAKHNPQLNSSFPAKARSKRSQNGSGAWSSHSESYSMASTSSSTSSSPSSLATYTQFFKIVTETSSKKRGRKPLNAESINAARRCTHCGVQKTPQWRTGPMGAKTLCNACGVRFKSGRLLPEYRPACSPTFSSDLHSNSHRKVMEMRRKMEGVGGEAVQSF